MSELITAALVDLDLSAETKYDAARSLAERMVTEGRVSDLDGFLADVAAREAQMPTGLDGGIGIPHCRSEHVTAPTLAFGRSERGIDFGAADGPADLIFLIAAPAGADDDHLTILSALARRLMDPDFTSALRAERALGAAAALIRGEEATSGASTSDASPPEGAAADGPAADSAASADKPFRIVAVTSCPTGIAHTYMAAESLAAAARAEGVVLDVETQGSAGFERLDPGLIAAADAVIWAHDVEVREKARFDGKPIVDTGVKAGINRPAALIAEAKRKAERGENSTVTGGAAQQDDGVTNGDGNAHFGIRLRTYLMSGVSYMVPFVAAGASSSRCRSPSAATKSPVPNPSRTTSSGERPTAGPLCSTRSAPPHSPSWCRYWPVISRTAWRTGPRSSLGSSAVPSPSPSTRASLAASRQVCWPVRW